MNNDKKMVRAAFNGEAKTAHDEMLIQLKSSGKYIKINTSKLVAWIILRYFEKYFNKEKEIIIKEHFDSKEYLLSAVKTASTNEELTELLKDTLGKVSGQKKKNTKSLNNQ